MTASRAAIVLLLALSLPRDPVTPQYLAYVFYKLTFVYTPSPPPQAPETPPASAPPTEKV